MANQNQCVNILIKSTIKINTLYLVVWIICLIFVLSIKNINTMAKAIQFSEVTLNLKVSERGGGVEIDLTRFGFSGQKMSAYQNYLGGGMLGKVCATIQFEHTINLAPINKTQS